jgi:hypothetical protein
MTCVVGSGRKTRYCTGNGNLAPKDAGKQGFSMIFARFFRRTNFAKVAQNDFRRIGGGRPSSQVVDRPQVARRARSAWADGRAGCSQVDQRGAPR